MGKLTESQVEGYSDACRQALLRADGENGGPAHVIEIARAWSSSIPMKAPSSILMGLTDLYVNNEVLSDISGERWTFRDRFQSTK